MSYFPEPETNKNKIEVELDLPNYATKSEPTVDTSLVDNLANLKSDVDEFYIDELKTTSVDLSKLSNVVSNDVVKKDAYYSDKMPR